MPSDTEELSTTETPVDANTLTCAKCGMLFDHTGRGRPPKNCPDCRPARGTRTAAPVEDTAPKRPRSIDALQRNIQQQLALLGIGVALFDTFDSEVILKNAESGAKALSNLAATNPKIRAMLESGVEGAGWVPVGMWLIGTVLPILAHHGMVPGVPDPARSGPASPEAGPGSPFPFPFTLVKPA